MYREPRVPHNRKEFVIFLVVVAFLSVNLIAPVITGMERGFTWSTYLETLKFAPLVFLIVIVIIPFIINPLVGRLVRAFVRPADGFNARVLFTVLFTVTVMSLTMTVIGNWVGTGSITLDPFRNYFEKWPRNFAVAFWIEALIVQPIARQVMVRIHARGAVRTGEPAPAARTVTAAASL